MITGPAGSGKTTLGRALALRIGAPHLDLDDVTADLVDAHLVAHPDRDQAEGLGALRTRRYEQMAVAARDVLATDPTVGLVLIAPFTSEISSAGAWSGWAQSLGVDEGDVHLVWLAVPAQERFARMAGRGAPRDASTLAAAGSGDGLGTAAPPVVDALVVDALRPVPDQVDTVVQRFGNA